MFSSKPATLSPVVLLLLLPFCCMMPSCSIRLCFLATPPKTAPNLTAAGCVLHPDGVVRAGTSGAHQHPAPSPAVPQFPLIYSKGFPGSFKPPPPAEARPLSLTQQPNREPRGGCGRAGAGRPPPLPPPPHGSARGAGSRPPRSAPPEPRGRPALNRHRYRRSVPGGVKGGGMGRNGRGMRE